VIAAIVVAMLAAVGDSPAVNTVAKVDLERYLGTWYELARFPNRFQKQCEGDVRATYAKRSDGRLDVINECRTRDGMTRAVGIGRIVDTATNAKLKVRFAPAALSFLPFVWGDYWIIGLDDAYRWAVVGTPDRRYLWILSRTPALGDEEMSRARRIAAANGFDVSRLVTTPQAR
jgi:apolipoprotein D and lipocalin family protein